MHRRFGDFQNDGRASHRSGVHRYQARLQAIFVAVIVVTVPAHAADDPPTVAPETTVELERVEVTGSRIRRIDGESALPVQILRRDDIDRSGAQSTEQLLKLITANVGSVPEALSVGGGGPPGFAGASLRGLGSTRTLVLLDGRRLSNYAFADQSGAGVDLHAIPLQAIERVEVLKDGASAIYGSDAIGGVINFILKKNFQGADLSIYRGNSQGGGGAETRGTATLGFGNPNVDRFNVFAVFDYQKKSGLAARDRSFSDTAYLPDQHIVGLSSAAFPANIYLGRQQYANPSAPGCTDQTILYKGGCFFNYPQVADLLPPTEQASVLVRGTFAIDAQHEIFLEALYDRSHVRSIIAPTPVAFLATNGDAITLPATSPFYPTGLGLTGTLTDIRFRTGALGPRINQSTADQNRVVLGTRGSVGEWDYDAALIYNESRASNRFVSGFVDSDAIANALATGLINPFGDSGPVGDAALSSTQVSGVALRGVGIARGADFHASRDLFSLPAGPFSIALGVDGRRESLNYNPTSIGDTASGVFEGTPTAGHRSAEAAYAEFSVPILKSLDAQIAVREDRYSDFGSTHNPKFALRWQPVRAVLLRASYGRGFRAPSLPELFTAQTDAYDVETDNVRCPVTGDDADCNATFKVRSGGNATSLKPERSEQASAGIVLEPSRYLSASVDWYKIRLTNQIGALDENYVLTHDSLFEGTSIVRGPVDPNNPTLPGPITEVILTNQNLGAIRTHGLDVQLDAHSDLTAFGRFEGTLTGTFNQEAEAQDGQQTYTSARANDSGGFVIPRWTQYLSLDWNYAAWTVSIHEQLQTGYTESKPDPVTLDPVSRHVGNYESWGTQVSFAGIKHLKVSLGVDNLFNRAPPFTFQQDYSQLGYNPVVADPRGRFWSVKMEGRFP